MKGIIVGIDSFNNQRNFRMVGFTFDNGKWDFNRQVVAEEQLVALITSGRLQVNNAVVEKGKIKGSTGSLDRFNSAKGRPVVILSILMANGETVVGYKIADYDGNVKNIKATDMLMMCKIETDRGNVPIQNGMFVPDIGKNGAIRCYPNGDYTKEIVQINKPATAVKANPVTKNKVTGATGNPVMNDFTPEQIQQIMMAKNSGVNYKLLRNEKFTPEQMKVLRETMEDGLNAKLFADPAFSADAMRMYRADMRYKVNIRYYLNPAYSVEQLSELSIGYLGGVDISQYSDPKLTPEEMAERRVRLESKIWKGHAVKEDKSWKN